MKCFVIYPTYKIIENRAYVYLFGKLDNGESFLTINYFRPYFYIKKEDLEFAQALNQKFDYLKTGFRNFKNEEVVKIILDIPEDVPKLRRKFEENQIACYEADVRFAYRFMMDKSIQGSFEIEGDYIIGDRIDRVYKEPEIKACFDYKPNLKVLSFDIESGNGTENDLLYCIGLVCGNIKKVFINSKENVEGAVSCNGEKEVIEKFIDEILILDPDIITGWNVIDFDLAYLSKKCKKLKIGFDIGREPSKCKIRLEENFFRESKADISGRQVLDGLNLLRVSFIKVDDYKLDTVSKSILGEGKLIEAQGPDKYKEIDELFKNNKKKLVDYNLKDAELVIKILGKTKVLELSILRSLLTGMPLDRVNASIASFDSLYLRELNKRNIVAPSGNFVVKEEGIKGGYVRESLPGIYNYILILDFKSLYPSMMRTFNIDPYSYVSDCKGKNLIKAPNGACFRNEDGVLPEILTKLYHEREKARKEKDELTKYAIKILMNSFFGVLANPSCRFFDINMTNAITYFGQDILKITHEEIKKLGYDIAYGDTDSSFVISKAKDLEEAENIGKNIAKYINEFYKKFIKNNYNRESFLELSYEKCFVKCLMPKLRKSDVGAKKRYAGLVIKNGKEEIQFTGLEVVRGDWTNLAKKYQQELLDRVFHNKEVINYTKKFVDDLNNGRYNDLLVYKKTMRKGIEDYAVETPHKKAAKKLIGAGIKLESNIIRYVMTEDGPEPFEHIKHKIDYKHYIEKQIKPIANSILVFFNTDFESLLNGNKQTLLDNF